MCQRQRQSYEGLIVRDREGKTDNKDKIESKRGRKTQEVAKMVEKRFLGYGYLSRAESKRMRQTEGQVKKKRRHSLNKQKKEKILY
jgi:hypothetical protein